ncbi:hypothetical protein PK28_17785 (plasmid) [Hymenobacter sp. DG25B]|nr:hypothetical protein PK28_17785 [Hymenobacter sp. DG25B]
MTFSQAVGNSASSLAGLQVFSAQRGGKLAGTSTVAGSTLTFDPLRAFKPGEQISVTLTSALKSTAGAALAKPYVYQFTAAATGGTGSYTRAPISRWVGLSLV